MNITVVCEHCRHHDRDPAIEINFRDKAIYYICQECKKESKMDLKTGAIPLPRSRRL